MAITWDNSSDYSANTSTNPGFWLGENAPINNPGFRGDVRLIPNNTVTAYLNTVTVPAGANINSQGDTVNIVMTGTPDSGYGQIQLNLTATYQGAYYYTAPSSQPPVLGQFTVTGVNGVTVNGEQVDPDSGENATIQNLLDQLNSNNTVLYLQLNPSDSTAGPPVQSGSSIVITKTAWSFSNEVPSLEIVCFLSGSMITTETGSKAVEDLAVGDIVLTGPENNQKFKPVTWVGCGHVDVQPDLPSDRAGYPICIRKNALGENSPNADLYVTPEHTLYIKGHLVPARMLVNHRSICYAYDKPSYDYYHFETADHSIIYANNLATESYLDTGNRRHFQTIHPQQKGNILTFPTPKKWAKDACAPLAVTADFVQPLHQMLEERAKSLGFPSQKPAVTLTKDANFHLITDKGETLYPLRRVKDRLVFRLPEGVKMLHLRSRTSRPCDTLGPYVDDRRNLGVLVGEIELHQGGQVHAITHHLTEQHPGWDVVEHSPCRWTNGNALLPLHDPNLTRKYTILTIQLLAEGPYIEDLDQEKNISQRVAS